VSRRPALAASLLLAAACAVAEPRRDAADTGASVVVQRDVADGGASVAPERDADAVPAPSAADRPSRPSTRDTVGAPPSAMPNAAPPADGAEPPEATPAELEALAATLVVPVAGVEAAELLDSFADSRGAGERTHDALDIPAPRGTAVLSATGGRVVKLFTSEAGGLMVYAADATERFVLLYGHLDAYEPSLREGAPLVPGQRLGIVGTTGNAPANVPHLHFGITRVATVRDWWRGRPVNPYPLLARRRP
jgi:murein DD-endopeptidase MepM/ murein hydrolase activator NlpD